MTDAITASGTWTGSPHPAVSVVVPIFGENRAGLDRLLGSLRAQDYPGDAEIILVDNNAEPRHGPAAHDANVRMLHEPAPGSYVARNAALAVARGAVIAFTDSDCECAGDWLRRGVTTLLGESSVGIVGGAIRPRPARPGAPLLAERYDGFFHMRQQHYVGTMHFASTANCFVRRGLFTSVGLFDRGLRSGGDREWCRRAVAAGHRVAYEPGAVVWHQSRALPGLLIKARRLAGQEWSHARAAGAGPSRAARVEIEFYVARVKRLLDGREELPAVDRLAFFGLATMLQTVRFAELLRLSLTRGEPERR